MGRRVIPSVNDQRGNTVVITEVGVPTAAPREVEQDAARPLTFYRRLLICGSAVAVTLVGIHMSLAADGMPTRGTGRATADPVSACAALTAAAPGSTTKVPPAYTRVAVITAGTTIELGLKRPDGLLELCRDQVELAAQGVTTSPHQDELTPLPEGMSYLYKPPSGESNDGVVLKVAGVRLEDGTVADSLTLPDGRIAPKTPAS